MCVLLNIEMLSEQLTEAEDMILDLLVQSCLVGNADELDSCAHGGYADAMLWLAERGRLRITSRFRRRVIAKIVPKGDSDAKS